MKKIYEKLLIEIRSGGIEHKISTGKLVTDGKRFVYEVEEPLFTVTTQNAYYDAFYYVQNRLLERHIKKDISTSYPMIRKLMREALENKGHLLSKTEELKVVYYLYRDLIGLGVIESIYADPEIGCILCHGLGRPVHAYHSRYGWVETNIMFKNPRRLSTMIWRLMKKCVRLDPRGSKGILSDGSFIETDANMGFQLRKSKTEFTPQFLIRNKMATPAAIAFLDSLIKHHKNIMIVGQKASGKTMFLSGLLHMIDERKIISLIEKEPHIAISNLKWNSGIAKGKSVRTVLANYLRAKPDYIVLDEVDADSAKMVFSLLASFPTILTVDAGNSDVAINKIATKFGIAKSMIANIDAIVMLSPKRDIEEILEVHNYDKTRNEINAKVVFRKERRKLVALESRFMRSLGEEDKAAMQQRAKELQLLSKKS